MIKKNRNRKTKFGMIMKKMLPLSVSQFNRTVSHAFNSREKIRNVRKLLACGCGGRRGAQRKHSFLLMTSFIIFKCLPYYVLQWMRINNEDVNECTTDRQTYRASTIFTYTESIKQVVRCMRNEFECAFASEMEMIKAFHTIYSMCLANHMAYACDACNVQEYSIDVCVCV